MPADNVAVSCFCDLSVDDCSEAVRALGYPRVHRHRLACLRQELVDAFVE